MIWDSITFPNLDPVAWHFGTIPGLNIPLDLRWYALAYIVGLVLGWRWMVWLIRRDRLWTPGKPPLSVMQADDYLFWATLGVILGGRIGYILFYNTSIIWTRPAEILQIWNGGMSFHGGLIGVAIATIWFTRQKHFDEPTFERLSKGKFVKAPPKDDHKSYTEVSKLGWIKRDELAELRKKSNTATIPLLPLGDLAACAAPMGLFFGRLANFINGELWGRPTTAPWGVIFCNEHIRSISANGECPAGMDPRHPSQLYEATLEGLLLFAIINVMTLKFDSLRRPGLNTGVFLICYGLFRLSLEFVREPDAQMPDFLRGYVTMGMLLCIPMMAIGVWLVRRALGSAPPIPKPA